REISEEHSGEDGRMDGEVLNIDIHLPSLDDQGDVVRSDARRREVEHGTIPYSCHIAHRESRLDDQSIVYDET
ncbi:hypothetical protein PFISCL1PPCAC_21216, partial [Pristionchus fissidentatus]